MNTSQWLLEVPHFYLKLTKNTQLKNIFAKKKQHLFALQSIKKSNAVLKELGNFSTNSYSTIIFLQVLLKNLLWQ